MKYVMLFAFMLVSCDTIGMCENHAKAVHAKECQKTCTKFGMKPESCQACWKALGEAYKADK